MKLPYQIVVVSSNNAKKFDTRGTNKEPDIVVIPTIEELVCHYEVEAAIIVNAARLHDESALFLMRAGISVLVEKPLALSRSAAESLYDCAVQHGVHLAPSLTFRHCSYLYRFAQIVRDAKDQVRDVHLVWSDPTAEMRYGDDKAYDSGVSVAQDVMPHAWSVLTSVLGENGEKAIARSCSIQRGGRLAEFELTLCDTSCRVVIERDGAARQRVLTVTLSSGQALTIDFTVEPGFITYESDVFCADLDWGMGVKPVQRQLLEFFELLNKPCDTKMRKEGIGTVILAETADELLKEQQRSWLSKFHTRTMNDDIVYAIRDLASSHLYKTKNLLPGDQRALNQSCDEIISQARKNGPAMNWLSAFDAAIAQRDNHND